MSEYNTIFYNKNVSKTEYEKVVYEFNNAKTDFTKYQLVYEVIDKCSYLFPNKVAVVCDDESITYKELYEKSNQLSWYLRERGVENETIVSILLERSIAMVIGILAVWKAGGAYLPLDTTYPLNRIKYMLNDSNSQIILTSSNLLPTIEDSFQNFFHETNLKHILYVDKNDMDPYPLEKLQYINEMSDLCYVIYTSGSTGVPKGVQIEHIGMINHLHAMESELALSPESVIVQNASQCFDISVWQFFNALIVGGQTKIYNNRLIQSPNRFIKRLISDDVTVLQVVPSYLSIILDALDISSRRFNKLCYLLVTGEKLNYSLLKRWFDKFPKVKVVNAYGPAEASDDITLHIMDKIPEEGIVPIGKPVQNFNIYIIDDNNSICPIGAKGEICVSGIGVGRGYLNDELRNIEKFTLDPFKKEENARMFKTGDYGRWLPEGILEFLGRSDNMVKIRGYRIELEEIENVMSRISVINDVAVISREYMTDEKYLYAYYTSDIVLDSNRIKEFLSSNLPYYMIPRHFIQLDKMPLNSNGKIDRAKLSKSKSR